MTGLAFLAFATTAAVFGWICFVQGCKYNERKHDLSCRASAMQTRVIKGTG